MGAAGPKPHRWGGGEGGGGGVQSSSFSHRAGASEPEIKVSAVTFLTELVFCARPLLQGHVALDEGPP